MANEVTNAHNNLLYALSTACEEEGSSSVDQPAPPSQQS